MPSILLTQCLQHDFVRPLGPYESLPNLLHVGHAEARRLMGEQPDAGPIARMMNWAHRQESGTLRIVHLRDWHDGDDPSQQAHLKRFGVHCLQHTPGAEFVFAGPKSRAATVVDSLSLNDFHQTELESVLGLESKSRAKIGVIGVWTEAKVYFLCYELITRYPQAEVVVCSALTASSSLARHFQALDQLERILGVRVVHSLGEFVEFLGGSELPPPVVNLQERHPEIQCAIPLHEEDRLLLRHLFRDCRTVVCRVLDGGFSGNIVLGTESEDLHGHEQVPHVVKIGPHEAMGKERAAFERIRNVLGNNAPQIADFCDFEERGAIKYRYASMGGAFSSTFQKLVEEGREQERVDAILYSVFGEQLQRLYKARTLEETDLLEHYQFSPKWGAGVRRRVEELLGGPAEGEQLELLPGLFSGNLCRFYEQELHQKPSFGRCYQAYVHGDLNGANIIVDGQKNVWLIDFFHTRRAHVLMDLIKLENDLLYIFTKLDSEQDLRGACQLFDHLLEVEDLAAELPSRVFEKAKFQRCWNTLRTLRSFYGNLLDSDRGPYQWWVGALRYAAHSLGFEECSKLQKTFALYASGRLADRITEQHRLNRKLRVDWVEEGVGLTILPGRADRGRSLADDLSSLSDQGVKSIVCMVPRSELEHYGVPELLEAYHQAGFVTHYLPVVDQKVCSLNQLREAVQWMVEQRRLGRPVMAHCVGGLGRSGFLVAAFLVEQGLTSKQALERVRAVRSPRAIETEVQEQLVAQFEQSRNLNLTI